MQQKAPQTVNQPLSDQSSPAVSPDAQDWRVQFRNRITTVEDLEKHLALTEEERQLFSADKASRKFPFAVTPYYLNLIDPEDSEDPIRKMVIPRIEEQTISRGDLRDPLGEDDHMPVPGIVHRYPDRALLLVANHCPVYCRYCTRGRQVGGDWKQLTKAQLETALEYIRSTPEIHDVLISGGEPLLLPDSRLDWLLGELEQIDHLDYVRIGTKVPMVLPQRITADLCRMLKRHHPLFLSIHINHPNELTEESRAACARLADAGIPLGSQTVLLKGVNDNTDTLKTLFRGLLKIRVKPYYLLQCDPIIGSGHFRTRINDGLDIMRELRGRLSGYGIPHFILDIPEGGGKIPLVPDYISDHDQSGLTITNYEGRTGFRYEEI